MVYFDVTSSCKSPLNTGLQRTTRELLGHLEKCQDVRPIYWNALARRYEHIGRREREVLNEPFRVLSSPIARPDRLGRSFLAELRRFLRAQPAKLETQITPDDVLFVPDVFRDGRIQLVPESSG